MDRVEKITSAVHLTLPPIRRRRYIVNPLQVKLGLFALLLLGSAIFAIWWEAAGCLADLQTHLTREFHNPDLAIRIASYSQQMNLGILLKSIFVMAIIWLVVVLVSHHFFGPIYRLKVCLKALKEGDYSCRMHLRKNDYLLDVQDAFNEMAATLEKNHDETKCQCKK